MAVAARRLEQHTRVPARPSLRLVSSKRSSKRTSSQVHVAYEAFVAFCVIAGVLALAALGRVWLSAEAAEASIRSSELRQEIKAARFAGDTLEVQESRLSAPGRVEKLAKASGMGRPKSVSYIDLRGPAPTPKPARRASEVQPKASTLSSVMDTAVGVAAGEARVLLVGDVGLSATK